MEYDIGKIGRVIVARGFDGEDVYAELESLATAQNIRCGTVLLIGGLRSAKVVVGPESATGPIKPTYRQFDDAREIVGVGTIFWDETKASLHLHAAIGRGDETIAGCPRGGAKVFCVLEAVIFEIVGVDACRRLDEESGLKLLSIGAAM
ncbi:MAG: DNA-binding protein [Planctomycetes bacterium]|nr:DNA-binding protein [Planctomycetota bacterium]